MVNAISRQILELWNRYKPTIAVNAIEYDRELKKLLGTNLASLGTDCISREAVLNEFCHLCDGWSCNPNTCCKTEWIRKLPPIQPKRGKWIKTARWGRVYYCDQCRNYLDFDGVNAGRGSTNYCPNCGCRMDGGEQ